MIQVSNLAKGYGARTLFEKVSFTIGKGERVGLVGRNGHGKSTLARIIEGKEESDGGTVIIPQGYHIGILEQHLEFSAPTVKEEVYDALPEQEGGWRQTYQADAVLLGLGFSPDQCDQSPHELSGGFQIRLRLARLLVSDNDLLILDEPTNYLDIVAARWLKDFLRSWPQELLLITHDREFMDDVVTHIIGINRTELRKVAGTTNDYYDLIDQEDEIYERTRANELKERARIETFIRRFRAKASKARQVQSKVKLLERSEKKSALTEEDSLSFEFSYTPFTGKWLGHTKDLSFGYTPSIPLIADLSFSIKRDDRIGIVGPNGKGKSTLLRLIAKDLAPNRGEITYSASAQTGYFAQTNISTLPLTDTIEHYLQTVNPHLSRSVIRTICGVMMFSGDDALKKIDVLSGGERSRVLLGSLLARPTNLLLLDEPTHHLDQESVHALTMALQAYQGAVIIVSHSEMVLKQLCNRLIIFDNDQVTFFEGSYPDFLQRIGWSSEGRGTPIAQSEEPSQGKSKESKRQRALLVQQRAATLKPLRKEVDAIEKRIEKNDELLATYEQELLELNDGSNPEQLALAAQKYHDTKEVIDQLFGQLEEATKTLEETERSFD